LAKELLVSDYLQADETPVGAKCTHGRGKNHQGYLWQYSQPAGAVIWSTSNSHALEKDPNDF